LYESGHVSYLDSLVKLRRVIRLPPVVVATRAKRRRRPPGTAQAGFGALAFASFSNEVTLAPGNAAQTAVSVAA